MNKILNIFRNLTTSAQTISPGVYHYQAPPEDPRNYRLHLRIEPDGNGVLILNASTILHLNQTATEYAYYMIHNLSAEQVGRRMMSRYNISNENAKQDYLNLSNRLQTLINTPDLDPITFLDFERHIPYTGSISAPYRLDCALTYRLPEHQESWAAPIDRVKRELSLDEWKFILKKSWEFGIPHIVFTGGEPTLYDGLPELIAFAEANGQVTGLLSDGVKLIDDAYRNQILQTGLDHLMIILRIQNNESWLAIEKSLAEDLFVAVHLTLSKTNPEPINDTLNRLVNIGIKAVSLSTDDAEQIPALEKTRELVANLGLELIWNLPVPYSNLHPVALETQGFNIPDGAGRAWLYVEPDGDVLPSQGVNQILGNLLSQPWDSIWKK